MFRGLQDPFFKESFLSRNLTLGFRLYYVEKARIAIVMALEALARVVVLVVCAGQLDESGLLQSLASHITS